MSSHKIEVDVHSQTSGTGFKQAANDIDELKKSSNGASTQIKKQADETDNLTKKKQTLSGKIKSLTSDLSGFSGGLGGATSKMGGLAGALSGIVGLVGGLPGVILIATAAFAAFAYASFNASKTSQAEWAEFKGIVESTGGSFDEAKAKVKEFAMEAGVSITEARAAGQKLEQTGHFSKESLRSVHEMGIGLKSNMEDSATAYTRIVEGSGQYKRTLIQLGINPEDIMDKTTGKVNEQLLQQKLEEKYGKAADNFAQTSETAGQRLETAGQGVLVAFGGVLQGPLIALENGLAWLLNGLTAFAGGVYNGIKPAIDQLTYALGVAWNQIAAMFPPGSGGTAFQAVVSAVVFVLTIAITVVSSMVSYGIMLGQALWNAGTWIYSGFQQIYSGAVSVYSFLASIVGMISGAVGAISGAFHSAASWVWGLPGMIWGLISNAIPHLEWPSPWSILDAIKGALGFRGPPSYLFSSSIHANIDQLRAQAAAAKAAAAQNPGYTPVTTPGASSVTSLSNAANTVSNVPWGWLRGPLDGLSFTYQDYPGHQKDAWTDENTLVGNCVDMTLGLISRFGGAPVFGTWDGGPHMWWMSPNGQQYDPARKALDGTFSPPARGPGGNTIVVPVSIGGEKVAEFIIDTVTKEVYDAGRF